MIDKSKLPKQTYNELVELLGYEKAEEFLDLVDYNFQEVQLKILTEGTKKRYGKKIWIYFWIIGLILIIAYQILSASLIL
jgi:tetrahydromethanopterin S-methyltransferase subunit G